MTFEELFILVILSIYLSIYLYEGILSRVEYEGVCTLVILSIYLPVWRYSIQGRVWGSVYPSNTIYLSIYLYEGILSRVEYEGLCTLVILSIYLSTCMKVFYPG